MKILYFAWVRDNIGYSQEKLSRPKNVGTLKQLAEYLKLQSDGHARAFSDLSAIRASINQQFVSLDTGVVDSDEVAFFPPVTGG